MNDYLTHLITRSLSQEDVILPRPSSLYETAAPATDTVHLEEESAVNVQPLAVAPAPTSTVAAQPTNELEPETMPVKQSPDMKQTPIAPPLPSLPPWLEQLRSLTQQPPAAGEPIRPVESEINTKTAPTPVLPQPNRPKSVPDAASLLTTPDLKEAKSRIEPRPQEIIERQFTTTKLVERVEQTPVISETIIEREKVPAAAPASFQSSHKKEAKASQPAKQRVVVTETRPYHPPVQPTPTPDQQDKPAPPAIHVTIGRVEIRATKSTPTITQRRPRQAKSSVMSLDDYLQQRANGEKR